MLTMFLYVTCLLAATLAAPVPSGGAENELNGNEKLDLIIEKLDTILSKLDKASDGNNGPIMNIEPVKPVILPEPAPEESEETEEEPVQLPQEVEPQPEHPIITPVEPENPIETQPPSEEEVLPEIPIEVQPEHPIVEPQGPENLPEEEPVQLPEPQPEGVPESAEEPGEPVNLPAEPEGEEESEEEEDECSDLMCMMECAAGFKKDENNCDICECNPEVPAAEEPAAVAPAADEPAAEEPVQLPVDPCADRPMCAMYCDHGFVKGEDGCDTCACYTCSEFMCMMECEHGFKQDEHKCDVCECAEAAPEPEQLPEETDEDARPDVITSLPMLMDHGTGTWGKHTAYCPSGLASSTKALVEMLNGALASMYAIEFTCTASDGSTSNVHSPETYAELDGEEASPHMMWGPVITCPENSFLAGFHVQMNANYTVVERVFFGCDSKGSDGTLVPAQEEYDGSLGWTIQCPAQSAFCGLNTRIPQNIYEGMGEVKFSCCPL